MSKTAKTVLGSILGEIVPPNIAALPIYQPGKPLDEVEREIGITGAIKLASNESVTGPSPRAVEAMQKQLSSSAEYPDGGAFKLRRKLAAKLGVGDTELVFGGGCNEIIHMAIRALCRPGEDEVLTHDFAFISYKIATLAHGATFVSAKTTDVLGCDVDDLLSKVSDKTRIVFLANPNNPTGSHLSPDELARVVDALPERVLLVVDEAYYEYASRTSVPYSSSLDLRSKRPMLLTLRTFSKIYGLAGLRIGYGIAGEELITTLERVRRPFNVNALAQAAALASLDDDAHVEKAAALAIGGVERLRAGAIELGLRAYPSLGNFVLVDVDRDSTAFYDQLLRRGVIVRPMKAWGLPTCIRVSCGTDAQNERALQAIKEVATS